MSRNLARLPNPKYGVATDKRTENELYVHIINYLFIGKQKIKGAESDFHLLKISKIL